MVFTNDLTIDADHQSSHAHVAGETATLLGRGNSTSHVSRFGLVGFLLACVAVSSSTFVFLLNQGTTFPTDVSNVEAQVAKAQRPSYESSDFLDVLASPKWMTSSFAAAETSNRHRYFTYDDFSEGKKGKPIFVISYKDYKAEALHTGGPTELATLIIKKAKELQATIIVNLESDKVFEAIDDYGTKLGCVQDDETNPKYCLILLFEEKPNSTPGGVTLLTVSKVGANDNRVPIIDINPSHPNAVLAGSDAIVMKNDDHESRLRAFLRNSDGTPLSDGILKQPEIMQVSQKVIGYCPVDEITRKKKPDCPDHKHTDSMNDVYALTMEEGHHKSVVGKFRTRLFNGKLPGETIKIKAGHTLRIQFHNKLNHQEGAELCRVDKTCKGTYCDVRNVYCEPDHTNIHLHGFWGSGEEPSDDIEMKISPVGNPEKKDTHYSYMSKFRPDHMPGTHWVHTHPHGASALQNGGGTAFALIVEDRPNDDSKYKFRIPPEVANATDVVLVVQNFNIPKITEIASKTFGKDNTKTDKVFNFETNPENMPDGIDLFNNFRLVNGQYQPEQHIIPGEWQRFRVIFAAWGGNGASSLNLRISNNIDGKECETNLLAKDGMYLKDYPRALKTFPIPAAGRADIMVRCKAEGKYNVTHFEDDEVLFTIHSKGTLIDSEDPPGRFFFKKTDFPKYLIDPGTFSNPDCGCPTRMACGSHGCTINERKYKPGTAVHTIKIDEVINRDLEGIQSHPYHQHVYPFVITKGFSKYNDKYDWPVDKKTGIPMDPTDGGYLLDGDWHDTLSSANQDYATIQFHPREILGKVMLHCHRLNHEDLGMMSQEYVSNATDAVCSCDWKNMTHKETRKYSTMISKAVAENTLT